VNLHRAFAAGMRADAASPPGALPSGELFVFDFADASRLFTDTNGTTPVSAYNDPVSSIKDLNNELAVIDGGSAPIYTQNAALSRDGLVVTDCVFSVPGIADSAAQELTLLAACLPAVSGSSDGHRLLAGFYFYWGLTNSQSKMFQNYSADAAAVNFPEVTVAAKHVLTVDASGSETIEAFVDGVSQGTASFSVTNDTWTSYTMFSNTTGVTPWVGDITVVAAYPRILTPAEIESFWNYFGI